MFFRGRIESVDLKAWRDDAAEDTLFTDAFADHPDGVEVRAETEYMSVEDYWAPSRKSGSYATNATTFWIPKEWSRGGTWMSPRRDYQNDARFAATSTNVVEVRAAYSDYTQGIGKACLIPEYFPTEIYGDYEGEALYVEFERDSTNVKFTAYRHYGSGGSRSQIGSTAYDEYVDGRSVSLQAGTNSVQVYYGADLVIQGAHGISDMTNVYAGGVYPHFEFANNWDTTNAYVLVSEVVCQQLSDFTAPEE